MYYYKTKILYLWLLAALQTHATHIGQNNTDRSVQDCPLSGPSFPAAFDLSKSKTFAHAQDYFRSGLRDEFCSGSLNETDLVFTIDIFSTVTNSSVFSYHHVGKNLKDIVAGGELNDSTISRIGSVSKLFTAYSILAAGGIKVFNDPVTKYLPELKSNKSNDPITNIAWDDITVGALASQQGGTAGVPLELFNCPPNTGNCTIPVFLATMRDSQYPTQPAYQTPYYSDAGFAVLGRLLERMKNQTYNDALQSVLSKSLGLNHTTSMKPTGENLNAIVLPGSSAESSWGFDPQIAASTGGVYTSSSDLRKLGLSIMNSELLSSSDTRQWMKPRGHTGSLTFAVGAPWEIHRLALPITANGDRTRVLDLYTKLGGNAGYSAIMALSPEHGLGYSVMISGKSAISARYVLRDLVGDAFLPAAEHAAAANAKEKFAGTYTANGLNDTYITLTVDRGHAGFGIKNLRIMGEDARGNLTLPPVDPAKKNFAVRIYQTGITSPNPGLSTQYSQSGKITYTYRAVFDYTPGQGQGRARNGKSMFMEECESWENVGFFGTVDELILTVVDGQLQSIQHPWFPAILFTKVGNNNHTTY